MKTRFLQFKLALELLVGFFLAYGGILFFFSEKTNFEELALGTETVTSFATDSLHRPIHLLHLSKEEKEEVIGGWKERGAKPVVLILGNSQTHSINQLKDGDVNFVELIANRIDKNQDVLCASFPNVNLQELLLAYQYLKTKVPIRQLIVPVFMDDFREDGVRDVFFSELVSNRFLLPDSSNVVMSKINQDLVKYWRSKADQHLNRSIETLYDGETPQDATERFLNSKLDSNSRIWANRSNVRGEFFNWLYRFRNTIFQIKANTVRAMIPNRFETNRRALEELIRICSSDSIRMLVYIPPIRNDAQLPYEPEAYEGFKKSVAKLCKENGEHVVFKNYESSIPNQYWGYKAATNLLAEREVDYMHFQFVGHQIMADSILTFLRSQPNKNGF